MKETIISVNANPDFKAMALDYISKCDNPRYYRISYMYGDSGAEVDYLCHLTEEQVAEIAAVVAQSKEEELPLWEIYEEMGGVPEYLCCDDAGPCDEPISADLETIYYGLKVRLAVFYGGLDERPEVVDTRIVLSKEHYAELLEWQLKYRRSGYNDLNYFHSALFKSVEEALRGKFADSGFVLPHNTPAFAVEFTGLKEDALAIAGEPKMQRDIYFAVTDGSQEHSSVYIENRILSFTFERLAGLDFEGHSLENVDAIAVEQALGVDCYKAICDKLAEEYGTRDGVDRFKCFLQANGISFTEQ